MVKLLFKQNTWNKRSLRPHVLLDRNAGTPYLRLIDIAYEMRCDLFSSKYNSFCLHFVVSTFSKSRQFFFIVLILTFNWIYESHLLSVDRFVDLSSTMDNKQNDFDIEDDEHIHD
jgi:hypothetical protein